MDKIGWKVVRHVNGGFQSARIDKGFREWGVSYRVGKRTLGKRRTPVLAFRTRQAARDFALPDNKIFRAELENPRPVTALAFWMEPTTFAAFWRSGAWPAPDWLVPNGTLACDSITLLEPA